MPKINSRVRVAAFDVRPYLAVLPAFLAGWRGLRFDNGIGHHPVSGEPYPGLQVVGGAHPYPGAVYRLVLPAEEPAAREPGGKAAPDQVVLIEVLADEHRRAAFAVRDEAGHLDVRVDIERPDQPGPVDVVAQLRDPTGGNWLTRGTAEIRVRLSVDQLPPKAGSEPQLVAIAGHPRGRGRAEVVITDTDPGTWTVGTTLSVGGAGVLRPVVGVAGLILRGRARRQLDEFLVGLPGQLAEQQRQLYERWGQYPDPELIAADALAELFAATAPGEAEG